MRRRGLGRVVWRIERHPQPRQLDEFLGESRLERGRRDLAVAYVLLTGLGCGILSAIISAPISATLFGGVTGSGADLLVAAFQQAGSDLGTAVLQQGLLQDPIDKTMEFFIVYAILQVVSRRITARFPQGERALGVVPADGEEELR